MAKDPRVQAAIEAYRRTLRNESGDTAGSAESSSDERLLADRPPHWAPKSRTVPKPSTRDRQRDTTAEPNRDDDAADEAPDELDDSAEAGDQETGGPETS